MQSVSTKIDFEATRHNMRLIRLSRYAAEKGFPESTLRRVLCDNYGPYRNVRYQRVIDALRADGFLVEVKVADDDSLAA